MTSASTPASEVSPLITWSDILTTIEIAVPGVVLIYCSHCSIPKVESADEVRQCETANCGVVACGECRHELFSEYAESDSDAVLCNQCI